MATRTILAAALVLTTGLLAPAEAQVYYDPGFGGFTSTSFYRPGYAAPTSSFAYRPAPFRATPFAAPYTSPLDPLGWFSPASPLGVVNPFNYRYGGFATPVTTTVGFGSPVTYGFGTTAAFGSAVGCGCASPCGAGGCGASGRCDASFTPADVPLDDPIDDDQFDRYPEEPIRERTFDSDAEPYDPPARDRFRDETDRFAPADDRFPGGRDDRLPGDRPGFDAPAGRDDNFGGFSRDRAPAPVSPPTGSGTREEAAPPFGGGGDRFPSEPADDGFGSFRGESDDSFGNGFGDPSSGSSSSFRIPADSRAPTDMPEIEPIVPGETPDGGTVEGVPPLTAPDEADGAARAIDAVFARATPGSVSVPTVAFDRGSRTAAFGRPAVARAHGRSNAVTPVLIGLAAR